MSRLAFLGSAAVSAGCLRALHLAGHDVALVVTEPDKRRGRGGALIPTPVKLTATELGLLTTDRVADVTRASVELGVVVAFGRLIKPEVLGVVPMVNLHFSLLPRWRGAAPVERAILAGDDRTGVCLMQVEAGLDTGGVYERVETAIGPDETADELRERLGLLGTELLVDRLRLGVEQLGEPLRQEGEATYAAKLSVEDLRLDFTQGAPALVRIVRVGRAWTTWRGARLIVHRAQVEPADVGGNEPGTIVAGRVATAEGWFVPREVQGEGRRRQSFAEWLRGSRPGEGERLGLDGIVRPGDTVS
ncbi:MAG: methionyl-tRNA formyltransferase [Acidimicrobiales bacterium]